nr:TetR/AcrR family transcriptional regulator [Oceanococcus sp. HetDA_MAG_MS8]
MRQQQRRQMLLREAAALVEDVGWQGLGMVALAERAGVTRQLVYQHFSSLDQLMQATAEDIFKDTLLRTQDSVQALTTDWDAGLRAAAAATLDLPSGRAEALWQLLAGNVDMSAELKALRWQLRDIIVGVWAPVLMRRWPVDEATARSQAWMLVMAFWGMRQLVSDGLCSREQALDQFAGLLQGLGPASPGSAGHPPP